MRSANPALNGRTFSQLPHVAGEEAMTLNGTLNCTALMLVLVMASAAYAWHQVLGGQFGYLTPFYFGGLFGGMLCVGSRRSKRSGPRCWPRCTPFWKVLCWAACPRFSKPNTRASSSRP